MPRSGLTIRFSMSALFFKRFLKRPFQIASIVPSSKALVERVAEKIDFDRARVIHYLSGDERAETTRQTFRSRRVRIFPAKHSADVHHRFRESERPEWRSASLIAGKPHDFK